MASSSSSGRRFIHPGPEDTSLLRFQEFHVSQHVWNGDDDRVLEVKRASGWDHNGHQ